MKAKVSVFKVGFLRGLYSIRFLIVVYKDNKNNVILCEMLFHKPFNA